MAKTKNEDSEPLINEINLDAVMNQLGASETYQMLQKQFAERMEPQIQERERTARDKGFEQAHRWQHFRNYAGKGVWIAGVALAASVGAYIISWPFLQDHAAHEAQLAACQAGNTVKCMEAVQDQIREHNPERVKLLQAAYILSTGKELPSLAGAGQMKPPMNGFAIEQTEQGVLIKKEGLRVDIAPNRVEVTRPGHTVMVEAQ